MVTEACTKFAGGWRKESVLRSTATEKPTFFFVALNANFTVLVCPNATHYDLLSIIVHLYRTS